VLRGQRLVGGRNCGVQVRTRKTRDLQYSNLLPK
jgi:hypothetical protein